MSFYPTSGAPFQYFPLNENMLISPIQASGTANVNTSEDTSPAQNYPYVRIAGTIYPDGAWYQSGSPNVPNTQITSVINSEYKQIPNQNMAPIQNSGTANVPTAESSWNV